MKEGDDLLSESHLCRCCLLRAPFSSSYIRTESFAVAPPQSGGRLLPVDEVAKELIHLPNIDRDQQHRDENLLCSHAAKGSAVGLVDT